MSIASAIFGGLESLFNIGTGIFDRINAKKQDAKDKAWNAEQAQLNRDFQREEREQTQDFNVDMWNMNNAYNSPAEQVKRLVEAGINPSAAFGGNSYSPAQSSPVTSSPMSGSTASTGGLASSMYTAGGINANFASNLQALASAKEAETQGNLNQYNLDWNKMTEKQRLKQLDTNIKYQEAQINGVLVKADLDKMSTKQIEENTRWIGKLNQAELDLKMQTLTNLYNENAELLKSGAQNRKESEQRIKESEQRINESESKIAVNNQSILESQSRTKGQDLENDILEEEGKQAEYETALKELEKTVSSELGLPLGSSEQILMWKLWKKGELPKFIDEVTVPLERATWTPSDWIAPASTYARNFNYKTGTFNPKWKSSEAEYRIIDKKATSEAYSKFK